MKHRSLSCQAEPLVARIRQARGEAQADGGPAWLLRDHRIFVAIVRSSTSPVVPVKSSRFDSGATGAS